MAVKTWIWGAVALAATVAFSGGCSSDDSPTGGGNNNNNGGDVSAPEEWEGRWAGTDLTVPCSGFMGLAGGAEPDTFSICEGEQVDDIAPEGFEINCSVTWNSTILDFNCTASATIQTCTVNVTIEGNGTRNGDQLNVMQETNFDYQGECFGQVDFCETSTGSYTRISTTPDLSECGFGEEGRVLVEGWVREALAGGAIHP